MSLRKPFKRGPVWYCEIDRRRVSLKNHDRPFKGRFDLAL